MQIDVYLDFKAFVIFVQQILYRSNFIPEMIIFQYLFHYPLEMIFIGMSDDNFLSRKSFHVLLFLPIRKGYISITYPGPTGFSLRKRSRLQHSTYEIVNRLSWMCYISHQRENSENETSGKSIMDHVKIEMDIDRCQIQCQKLFLFIVPNFWVWRNNQNLNSWGPVV